MSTSNPSFEEIRKRFLIPRPDVSALRIRAFRAVDDPASAMAFANGHLDVLKNFGLTLSSAKKTWMDSPSVYVILIEATDGSEVYGGARIEAYDGVHTLPIVAAVEEEAPEITSFLDKHHHNRIGEICGLWNSMSVAGLGVGSTYSIRCAIAIAELIGLTELVALCSPYTYRIANNYGFQLLEELGNKGAIPYAGANEIAHVTFQQDVANLPGSKEEERNLILDLRKNPIQTKIEHGRKKPLEVQYNLLLPPSAHILPE
jgi:hypothetical protein